MSEQSSSPLPGLAAPAFTEGPWHPNGRVIHAARPCLGNPSSVLAMAFSGLHSDVEVDANVRLLSAAPDLYDVLIVQMDATRYDYAWHKTDCAQTVLEIEAKYSFLLEDGPRGVNGRVHMLREHAARLTYSALSAVLGEVETAAEVPNITDITDITDVTDIEEAKPGEKILVDRAEFERFLGALGFYATPETWVPGDSDADADVVPPIDLDLDEATCDLFTGSGRPMRVSGARARAALAPYAYPVKGGEGGVGNG